MRSFSFENHNNIKVESGSGPILVGDIDLEAGSYMVWGKLSVGVNVASGYPPPPWPNAVGVAFLVLDTADDQGSYGLKPDSAENNATISLMCAATIGRSRRARLYIQNLYPLPVYCHYIKLMALQVDTLIKRELGEDVSDAPADKEEQLRDAILRAKLTDRALISDLKKLDG